MLSNEIKVRIAPSPTGPLHIGTARTALFNWLFAQKNKGEFILRIEDTDLERSDPKFEEDIKDSLNWLGLEWDEFYKQSDRIGIYKKYLQKLLDEGKAFWCFHTIEELKKESEEQMKQKEAPRHICQNKYDEVKNQKSKVKTGGIIRLKVDENSTRVVHFNDIIRGAIEWEQRLMGDLSLAKNLETPYRAEPSGFRPLYNFAVVIDDHETKISHVIRGEDHISNTPKQILISEALGLPLPQFAHLPLILGPDRAKLSKRHGAESVREYEKLGYLPEAMLNFMALLGWRPKETQKSKVKSQNEQPEDIYFIDELISLFNLKDVQKSSAVFDIKKLNWMNGYYIHQLPPEQFRAAIMPFIIEEIGVNGVKDEYLDKIQHLMTERMEKLSDIKNFDYFFKEPEYDRGLLNWPSYAPPTPSASEGRGKAPADAEALAGRSEGKKNMTDENTKKSLTLVKEAIESVDWDIFPQQVRDGEPFGPELRVEGQSRTIDKDYIRKKLDDLAKEKFKGDRGAVYWPLRVALTGKKGSPDPIDLLSVLPKETVIKRLNNAIAK